MQKDYGFDDTAFTPTNYSSKLRVLGLRSDGKRAGGGTSPPRGVGSGAPGPLPRSPDPLHHIQIAISSVLSSKAVPASGEVK
jgi:hypothetical protein